MIKTHAQLEPIGEHTWQLSSEIPSWEGTSSDQLASGSAACAIQSCQNGKMNNLFFCTHGFMLHVKKAKEEENKDITNQPCFR